jgi:flavin-dependent dehydrogenase
MESAEVLIIGGGPAGSSCAWKLRQSGADVMVLDKAQFPRHKVCAGWITPPIVDELKLDVRDYQDRHVMQPITRFLTGLIGGVEIETDYGRTVSYGIRRCEFDDYLLRRSGARLTLGEPFRTLHRDGADWIVNDRFRAPLIVGAGGHFCPVARHLNAGHHPDAARHPSSINTRGESSDAHAEDGAVATGPQSTNGPQSTTDAQPAPPELPVVLAQEVEFEMTPDQLSGCTVQGDRPELFFCPDLKGYGWVFRKGNFLNVGLGREAEEHLSTHVARFVEFLRGRGKVTFPLPGKFQGHAYHLRTELPRPRHEPGILLIGDAVGLADRQSGEGIRPAIESGLLCADCIVEAGSSRRIEVNEIYLSKLRRHFRNGTTSSALFKWIPQSLREFAARRLMGSHWFTRRVLLDNWFLHR